MLHQVVFLSVALLPAVAEEPAPSIHVVGVGEVKVAPDVVDIDVGVEMTTKDLNVGLGRHSAGCATSWRGCAGTAWRRRTFKPTWWSSGRSTT
jgi:hypothetical protein